jgi:hypothetical protein
MKIIHSPKKRYKYLLEVRSIAHKPMRLSFFRQGERQLNVIIRLATIKATKVEPYQQIYDEQCKFHLPYEQAHQYFSLNST